MSLQNASLARKTAISSIVAALAISAFVMSPSAVIAEEQADQGDLSDEAVAEVVDETTGDDLVVDEAPEVEAVVLTAAEEEPIVLTPAAPSNVGWIDEDGNWTYYDAKGVKQYGFVSVNGKWYYLDPDNHGYLITSSTFYSSGKKYVAKADGECPQNSWVKIGSDWYYTGANHGDVSTGWIKVDGKHYYMGNDGILKTGLFQVSGKNYIADDNGVCKESSWVQFGGDWYLTDSSCACRTGWAMDKGKWYYLNEGGDMATGWITPDGKTSYYLDDSGAMATSWKKIDGKWYFFDQSGAVVTGWRFDNGMWFYLDPSTGAMKANELFNDGKNDYIAKANGICPVDDWVKLGGSWYRTNGSCAVRTGWYQVDGAWYYSTSDGKMVEDTTFTDSKGNKYIASASGACPANAWIKWNGDWYFTADSCALRFGWVQYKSDWYYLDKADGHMLADTTTPDGYKVDANGKWVKA